MDEITDPNSLVTVEPEVLPSEKFNAKLMIPFFERSVSEETRRAYRQVTREFFSYLRSKHPAEVTHSDVQKWRDYLIDNKKSAATVRMKLSVIRSLFDYLQIAGIVRHNPALTKLVRPPAQTEDLKGRSLSLKEVNYLLSGPDQTTAGGARDYALILFMLLTSLRVSEVCSMQLSAMNWSHSRWTIKFKVKGGRTRTIPLPTAVKKAVDNYLKIDRERRQIQKCDGENSFIFQPHTNYRTLIFDKSLTTAMAWQIVKKWGEFGGIGKISPHDLRRTAITRALDQGLSYRQVQMMTGHKDPKTVMRYDHGRENLELNAVNFLDFEIDSLTK